MSRTKNLKRMRNQQKAKVVSPAPQRNALSITLTFDPARPQAANVTVMPLGGDGNGGAHIDDVVTALRMGYEQAVMQKGALLAQQQLAAQKSVSGGNGGQEGSAPA